MGYLGAVIILLYVIVLVSVHGLKLSLIKRTYDLTQNIPRLSFQVDISSSSSSESSDKDYDFYLPLSLEHRIGAVKVISTNNNNAATIEIKPLRDQNVLVVKAKNILKSSTPVTSINAEIALTPDIYVPYPEQVSQKDDQSILFEIPGETVLVNTPYETESQSTTIMIPPPGKVHSRSASPKPVELVGKVLKYGPYGKDVKENSPLKVHYQTNLAITSFTKIVRDIEISQWGNCAVEDYFELLHKGAKLVGEFSRLDFSRGVRSSALTVLKSSLPKGARDLYYRDVIGNISTSEVRYRKNEVELEISPRFPILGGWKTAWYQGYNLELREVATQDKATGLYTLRLPLGIPLKNYHAETYTIKVVLPAGSTNVKYDSPFTPSKYSMSERYTYLDIGFLAGRPVIVLDFENMVSPEQSGELVVTYNLDNFVVLRKPIFVSLVFFVGYLLYMAVSIITYIGSSVLSSSSNNNSSSNKKEKSL